MAADTSVSSSKGMVWTGRVLSGLVSMFLLMDGTMKLMKLEPVVQANARLGFPEGVVFGLGVLLLGCTVLYIIPRTSVLGAILLTGYLGGAVASHVRIGDAAFPVLFPLILGALLWLGLVLRDGRLRAMLPFGR